MKRVILVSVAIITVLVIVLGAASCKGNDTGKHESITFANLHLAAGGLIYIADEKHFFQENGLTVDIKDFDTGTATSDALLKGQADMATMAESVMVTNALQKQKVSILGTMDKTNTQVIVGLKTRGISKISELAGKRIGLGLKTSAEFYLGRFLEINGMNIRDVTLVNLTPPQLNEALSSNKVDAIVGWPPYTTQIQENFPDDTTTWEVQSNQPVFGIIVARNDWIANHLKTITRFWKSLSQAEDFLTRNPEEGKAIIRKRLNYDQAYLDSVWPQYKYSLSFDQSLILAMEDEARWMISNELTTEKVVPNFLDYINPSGLKAVKPAAVGIAGK